LEVWSLRGAETGNRGKEERVIKEFRDFILRGNAVELAVAVIMGAAFTSIINSIVKGLFTPLIGVFGGTPDFSENKFTINGSVFLWGDVVNAIISFLVIAVIVFFVIVKPMNAAMARMKRQEEVEPDAPTVDQKLLTEIRDLLKEQSPQHGLAPAPPSPPRESPPGIGGM
jgi:large conductance mechanosensitive channel